MQWSNSPDHALMTQWYGNAMQWYRRAADQDLAEAQFQVGRLYVTGLATQRTDVEQGMHWYQKAADQGLPEAAIGLAHIYEGDFIDVPRDDAMAMQWYQKAAETDATSQMFLAQMYQVGDGRLFSPDHALAAQWYDKAADQGYPPAERAMAGLYARGEGVPMDKGLAQQWDRKVAEHGRDVISAISDFLCSGIKLNFEPRCLENKLPRAISTLQQK
jgi:uncharacterized protein